MSATFHCDKLCNCDTCAPTRWALSYDEGFGKPLGSYAAGLFRDSDVYTAAWFASRDPAKLAELMVSALRARGVDAQYPRVCNHPKPSPMISLPYSKGTYAWGMIPSAFRAKLRAIMQTTADESSREVCERILRGET